MKTPRTIRIALAGNPNSGKTTIFNALTGSRQHVGNYPGVTVEKKEGFRRAGDGKLHITDLPGTYSLTAYSAEELVARQFILDEKPDLVIDVVDASNLRRSLYLATQLLELDVPLVLVLNMADQAYAAGFRIDTAMLSKLLGVPVVRTIGNRGEGIDRLVRTAVAATAKGTSPPQRPNPPHYGGELEPHVEQLAATLAPLQGEALSAHRVRWTAVKLLEGDAQTLAKFQDDPAPRAAEALALAQRLRKHIEHAAGQPPEIALTQMRYGFIAGICAEAVREPARRPRTRSDRVDRVLTHPVLGLPLFALLLYAMFQLTFSLGGPLVDLLDAGKEHLSAAVRAMDFGAGPGGELLKSLLADGIIEGVGAVLVFVPLIAILFAAIAVLEDTGYMARAAFVLDRLMHRIGMHGKSFIPMLIGLGCSVPAILSTRILETRRDRLSIMLAVPLMSCGARLPVYVLILGAFFPARTVLHLGPVHLTNQALLLFAIYAIGIVLAVAVTKVLRITVLRGELAPLVMELPPYRLPTPRGLAIHVGERTWQYVRKAGTIILAIVILLWALNTWPRLGEDRTARYAAMRIAAEKLASPQREARQEDSDRQWQHERLTHSAIGRIGGAIAPVLRPCGFDEKIATALLGAFAAKEVFVGQMGVIYAVGGDRPGETASLRTRLAADYTPLQGLCIMLFVLIASPCMATVAVTARESGSWKWAALQWTYLTALAWTLTMILYQAGSTLLH